MKITSILYLLLLGPLIGNAQENIDFSGNKTIVSPEINGKQITFRLLAPEAKTVSYRAIGCN
ncbi:hypothetical protein [Sphingobacterium sp. IITKGP-BTPF85]|uniref:hypothetical protein n=1 Tax=Sphingobacterium sp. IITKGP-BTPF85 TaxID=1338009 RepID=UPI000389E4DD|nr:hypothetical protein [Sphingobacterium sp. IITKGP-BTPF85]KKX47557.1 hypothetical protein L950_0225835 [Sphingobacterium sp. IITKGP-BTPF85]